MGKPTRCVAQLLDRSAVLASEQVHDQAKGRVERANQTLQDRLVREMRLRGISTIEEAQAFAPTFMARWNARFALAPRDGEDAHRPWKHGLDALDETLARREERTLSKALTFSVGGAVHCVKTSGPGIALRGAKVTLLHFLEGDMHVRYKNRSLSFTRVRSLPTPSPTRFPGREKPSQFRSVSEAYRGLRTEFRPFSRVLRLKIRTRVSARKIPFPAPTGRAPFLR